MRNADTSAPGEWTLSPMQIDSTFPSPSARVPIVSPVTVSCQYLPCALLFIRSVLYRLHRHKNNGIVYLHQQENKWIVFIA
jgi:hypothetical protein